MNRHLSVHCTILLSTLMSCLDVVNEASAIPPAYHVTDLGTLGGTYSVGLGINASGQVAGYSYTTGNLAYHAFLWTPTTPNGDSGRMIDLGTLGGTNSYGWGINDSGQVAGYSQTTGDAGPHAFLYDGTIRDLGTLGGTSSYAYGINDSGQVVGNSQTTGDAGPHAFLYDGTLRDLGTLGGTSSYAYAINDSGQVTGESAIGNAIHAFLYDSTMHDLGTFGGSYSFGYGINDSGQVAGASSTTDDLSTLPFLYDGTLHSLGSLGGTEGYGLSINASGQVVGTSHTTGISFHPFLYTSGSGMVDLNSLIDPLSGWELFYARAINDAGQITGWGYIGDRQNAFLLTPVPEPASVALVAFGLPLLVWRISRRSGRGVANHCPLGSLVVRACSDPTHIRNRRPPDLCHGLRS